MAASVGLPPEAARGQQPRETLPGFRPNEVFQSGPIDNINLFNGDPSLDVPLGPQYPLGPAASFQLRAYYSSKFWTFDRSCNAAPPPPEGGDHPWQHAYVRGYPTLGAGWTLELGYVYNAVFGFNEPPVTENLAYHSPDGGRHPIGSNGITTDGTNTRLTFYDPAGPDNEYYTAEFPDGNVHEFRQKYAPPKANSGSDPALLRDFNDADWDQWSSPNLYRYGLTSIVDRFGKTVLQVTYVAPFPSVPYPNNDAWQVDYISLLPGTAEASTIDFNWTTKHVGSGTGVIWDVLASITFPTASTSLTVSFTFNSSGGSGRGVWIARNAFDNTLDLNEPSPCESANVSAVPLLERIRLSEGPLDYDFRYILGGLFEGTLDKITLPTKGEIEYAYGKTAVGFNCILVSCADMENEGTPMVPDELALAGDRLKPYRDNSAAVVLRTEHDPYTQLGISTCNWPTTTTGCMITEYDRDEQVPQLNATSTDFLDDKVTRRVIIHQPDGNGGRKGTKHLFHAGVDVLNKGGGMELVRRFYETEDTVDAPTPKAVRSMVFCNESGLGGTIRCGYRVNSTDIVSQSQGSNPRQQRAATYFGVNPQGGTCTAAGTPCSVTFYENFNATAVQYAKSTTKAFSLTTMPNWTSREAETTFAPITNPKWFPSRYSAKKVKDMGTSLPAPTEVTTGYTFNSADGFLEQTSVDDPTYGTLKEEFPYGNKDARGNPGIRRVSGTAPLTIFEDQNLAWKSGNPLVIKRTGMGWNSLDVDRDAETGLITLSEDPNLLPTTYSYDPLGRLTVVQPSGVETATRYCYKPATASPAEPALAIVKRGYSNACTLDEGTPLDGSGTIEAYQYDGFGRLVRQIRRLPHLIGASNQTYFAVQEVRYNTAGLRSAASEWKACVKQASVATTSLANCTKPALGAISGSGVTSFSSFDLFGRARTITAADGNITTVSFQDGGVIHSDTLESVTVQNVEGASATTTTRRDVLGRVISVTEPSIAGQDDTTSYKYNVLDKLTEVRQTQTPPLPSPQIVQLRTFSYDSFGFLRSETHPERGGVTYSSYDALGNLLAKSDAGTSYDYEYDLAGRLTRSRAGGITFAVNCYDGQATCADSLEGHSTPPLNPAGHLTRRYGFTKIPTSSAVVHEAFAYGGPSGRLSSMITAVGNLVLPADADASIFETQNWEYNSLGLVKDHEQRTGGFKVTNTYRSGLLRKVDTANPPNPAGTGSPVTLITYNAAGGIQAWTANTGRVTTITPSAILARPSRITTSGSPGFDTGVYAYDGAGNIQAIGGDSFDYDRRSRLTKATYGASVRNFSYDRFGNLDPAGAIGVDSATNRLTGVTYDAANRGNATSYNGRALTYDPLDRQIRETSGSSDWTYLHSGADERLVKFSGESIRRREMARLIAEGNIKKGRTGWTLPTCTAAPFTDVSCSDPDARYIKLLKDKGFTGGCGGGNFCPEDVLTRAQMSVFLVKGYHEPDSYTPPACVVAPFSDVPCGDPFAPFIAELKNDGVTAGCGPNLFCPSNPVTSYEMMVFMAAAKHVGAPSPYWQAYNPVPRSVEYTIRDEGNRIAMELRPKATSGPNKAVLTDTRHNVYLGNLLVASFSVVPDGVHGWSYYTSDHLGTPRFTVLPTGTLTKKYWPYGEDASGGGTPVQRMQFALMERDGEAERHYVHARHQDVPLGRFLSPDQLGGKPEAPQSWNRYAYALSNPVKFIDPTGEQAVPGQGYVIGQGWTSRSVLDPANRPTPKMAVQFMAVTGAIGLGAAGLSLWEAAGLGGTVIPGLARFFSNPNATERGRQIEEALATRFGGGLPGTFPTIDRFANGVATSVKSLDLAARTYQNVGALTSRLTGFVNDLASFTGKVQGSEVTSKVLELVVPQGANAAQMQAIQKVAEYAKTLGVQVKVLIAQ